MGVVYLGFDPMLDRPVAIKVLKVPDEETRRRFMREARLAAKVHHPNIVSIYAVGEHQGNPYLAMEFIAGRTLSQVIRGGEELPLARKVHWLSELCAGLAHAHASGIVHRDVKPSNLLIAESTGTLRLLDFGIAHGNEASSMTMVGMIVGTPQYMSPEQITGQPADARSDIFSVGAVAYELLTGRQAFGGENLYHISRQIVSDQPRPIESFVPDVPNALVKTIARCLHKDPATRADSAKVLEREFLALARRLDPEHTLMVVPGETTVAAPARDVTTSRQQLLREAAEAIAQGELTTASGLLQKLESGTSTNADVQQLRQKLQSRKLEVRVQDAVSRADEATQTGSLDEAEAAINALADLSPRHQDLKRLRRAHQERIDERQLAALTSKARQALQQDRLEEAESLLAEALALSPDAPDALAVQQKLADRTRAQRIARLVAQASRALDQDDQHAARRAIEALARIDAAHRDVARLRARLAALTADTDDGHVTRPAVVPVVVAVPAMAPVATAPPPPTTVPPRVAPAPAPAGAQAPAQAERRRPTAAAPTLADGLLLRQPTPAHPHAEPAPTPIRPAAEDTPAHGPRLIPVVAVLALLALLGAAGYFMFGRARNEVSPADHSSAPVERVDTAAPADHAGQPGTVSSSVTPPSPPPGAPTEPVEAAPIAVTRGDPWSGARQLAAAGRYDRALLAIDQVTGVPAAQLQAERDRVVENARRYTLAARRGAEDLRLTRSAQYVLGTSRQAQADRDLKAGRLKSGVAGFMAARGHFLQAFNDSGTAAPAAVVAAPPLPDIAAAPVQPAPAAAAVDTGTWSTEEARVVVEGFQSAYLARDLGALRRLWPTMDPTWVGEFRDAFATTGALVCVFENVSIVRATDQFMVTARLLTQLPGEDSRRRGLVITLVPARDRLVIGNIRVR